MQDCEKNEQNNNSEPIEDVWCRCGNSSEQADYYEFFHEGRMYHGWNCSDCGGLLQTG